MGKTLRCATALGLLISSSGWIGAATYHVNPDDPGASDANPGTELAPWSSCPGMPGWSGSAVLQPGDEVLFANTATFARASGGAVLQVSGGVTYDGSSWGAGQRARMEAQAALTVSVINIREDDPIHPTVVRGFEVDANGFVTTGIGINWPGASGSLTGAVKRIDDCVVHDVASQSALGQYEYGIVVSAGYGGPFVVANVEIVDCATYNISRGGINVYAPNDEPTSRIENVLVSRCEVWATGLDPDYAGSGLAVKNHIRDCVVEYTSVHDSIRGGGIGISSHNASFRGPENLVIRCNVVRDNVFVGVLFHSFGPVTAEVYNNLILGNTYQGLRFMTAQGAWGVRISNNTLYHNTYPSWCQELLIGSTTATWSRLEVTNNLLVAESECRPLQDTDGDITAHGHNLLHREGGGELVYDSGSSYAAATLATWEPSALAGDPLLADTSQLPTGFSRVAGQGFVPSPAGLGLGAGSDALDAGQALSALFTTSINGVPRPHGEGWDIGAYEMAPGLLFLDGFETGDTSQWSAAQSE